MKILAIGASRNIGYFSAQRFLKQGAVVTYLVRNQHVFDNDESVKPYIQSKHARIIQGDATVEEDVRKAWAAASEPAEREPDNKKGLDLVLLTVGGIPKFKFSQGFVIDPPDLCTRSTLAVLKTFAAESEGAPRLVVVSSTGLGATAHSALPLALKPLYKIALGPPHADKLGMERLLGYVADWEWPERDGEPEERILPSGWKEREKIGPQGYLKNRIVVIRPALLTSGECQADSVKDGKKPYRVQDSEIKGSYTISRSDVAHFIGERLAKEWPDWEGKCLRIAY